ncbi:hypothetical protein F3Y22_tig00111832pilonHSYRG00109 [Hibiscus syriacus]|uniref:Uncharacterized protein n=1 Tax=Hibiscus syriacus TaxID=106335 RepID=A0A6A2XBN9_HIBSY|nr:hypothetical protein F3Y22_tig00111832pilonHSYRG00109 [Hibiscus syriacus]
MTVASGRENAGERLYMNDITDHGSFLNSHYILQRALNHTSSKDHRANHMVAKIRLKEDDEKGQKVNYRDMPNSEIRESLDVKETNNVCQFRFTADVALPAEHARSLPDYLRNPSRYTCYSFCSSSEVGEESNAQTWDDVLKLDSSSKSTESLSEHDDAPRDLLKSLTFVPKRKSGNLQQGSGICDLQEKITARGIRPRGLKRTSFNYLKVCY